MANIVSTSETKIYQIKKWLGLNESPDGDTHMKMGEAAEMRNFRITAENHLQIRPGYGLLAELSSGNPVRLALSWCHPFSDVRHQSPP